MTVIVFASVGPISVKKVLNLLAISILLGIGSSSSSKRIEIDFETVFTGCPKTVLMYSMFSLCHSYIY